MATAVSIAKLFVRAHVPYVAIPKGGKKIAARIARDFVELIQGFTERWNELHSTNFGPAEGLATLLNSNVSPEILFSQYRALAEQSRAVLTPWTTEKGYSEGWRWLTPAFADWFVVTILPRPYKIDDFHSFNGAPLLTKILIEHPRGKLWMRGFVEQLRLFLYPNAPVAPSTSGNAN
jgi:hypothetical protein